MKILLMGNPNVGKSVVFSRLTGAHVIVSNYPGTTVEFTKGSMHLPEELGLSGETAEVIDVPGVYSLEPTSRAEEVALEMLKQGDLVINVVNTTNLERSLNLTLQLLKKKIPLIVALNLWDEAKHTGIKIDAGKLEQSLGVPCIPTCAITGEGFKELVSKIKEAKIGKYEYEEEERWHEVGNIITEVEEVIHRHHRFRERIADASISPKIGIPIAFMLLFATFHVIRFIGEGLIGYVFEPFFDNLWAPLMLKFSNILGGDGFIHNILIGRLVDEKIDFGESFGLLTTGLFVPFGAVLPYIFAFYLILSFLEDSGYLPRLAVLVDNIMHRLGLHGMAIIPMILGLGCNVPGALSARILETKRERFIAATIMAIAVPCMAQIAMVVGLMGKHGAVGLGIVFGTLFIVWIILGVLLNKTMKGESMEIFLEIPPYRLPYLQGLVKKVWMRIIWFVKEAVPWVLAGVFIANILYTLGIVDVISKYTAPLISGLLGLPKEAVGALLLGFFRKDVAVGMLVPLNLTLSQLIVASVVLTMYFPCVATFATLVKELGIAAMLKSAAIMIVSTLLVGRILNLVIGNW
ncbi:MAG: ferrous iron transporter B [bacterium]|nr:ferrous iron transporter B [bacterium]